MKLLVTDFESWTPYVRDLKKKQSVTTQSLEKIEDGEFPTFLPDYTSFLSLCLFSLSFISAAYAIMVRTSEYDLSPDMLDDIVAQTMSSYRDSSRQPIGRGKGDSTSDDEDGS